MNEETAKKLVELVALALHTANRNHNKIIALEFALKQHNLETYDAYLYHLESLNKQDNASTFALLALEHLEKLLVQK